MDGHIAPTAEIVPLVTRFTSRRGTQAEFDALYPPGYTGTGGVDLKLYPKVLAQGEMGVCLDTSRVFLGALNGEYIELDSSSDVQQLMVRPATVILPPSSGFARLPHLDSIYSPFLLIKYSITDNIGAEWTAPGVRYTKSGTLRITASNGEYPTAVDTGNEISYDYSKDVYFTVKTDTAKNNIYVYYRHNFPWPLRLSTAVVSWVGFNGEPTEMSDSDT